MTDINLAYNLNNDIDEEFNNQTPNQSQSSQNQRTPPTPPQQQQLDMNEFQKEREKERERIMIHKQQLPQRNQLQEQFTNNYQYQRNQEYSFWDRMVMSKREVLKLFILSIVVILGISLEKVGFHYITMYLESTDLSTFQEFLVRISFPVIVFLILWIIKSL